MLPGSMPTLVGTLILSEVRITPDQFMLIIFELQKDSKPVRKKLKKKKTRREKKRKHFIDNLHNIMRYQFLLLTNERGNRCNRMI
jgi:hypothetical protein